MTNRHVSRRIAKFAAIAAMAFLFGFVLLRRKAQTLERQIASSVRLRANESQELDRIRARIAILPKHFFSGTPPAPAPELSDEGRLFADVADRRRTILRAWFDLPYGRFLRTTNLTPQQKDRFETAVIEHFVRWAEVVDVAKEAHLANNDAIYSDLEKEEEHEFTTDLKDSLGDDAYQAFQQFQRVAVVQTVADAVAGLVFDSGQPLSSEQANALTQIVANASARYRSGHPANLDDVDEAQVINEAQNILTPVQISALRTTLSAGPAIRQLNELLNSAQKAKP